MRASVLGSVTVHLVLLAVLFAVRQPMSIVVPGPDMVQVALIDPAAMVEPTPLAEPKVPEPKPEEIRPEEDIGVKLRTELPKKKKEEPKAEKPPKSERVTPVLPAESMGASGLQADLTVASGQFEFTYYLVLIRKRIAENWTQPAGTSTGGNPVRAEVYFEVGRGGELSNVRLQTSSGVDFFDRSALRAVTISDPMPPLPLGFPGAKLGIINGFTWAAP
jgi:protein TonB